MKTMNNCMRALHRDVGFFIIGLTLMFVLSGIVLVYRDIGFMKYDTKTEKMLPPNLKPSELGEILRIRNFKITKTEGDIAYFREGTYNSATGAAVYSTAEFPFPLDKFVALHCVTSRSYANVFVSIFGLLLMFLAVSSLWMFNKGTPLFRRGIFISLAGFIFSILVLLIL